MMVLVKLPSVFASRAGDQKRIRLDVEQGKLLGPVLDLLTRKYPELRDLAGIGPQSIPDHINIYHNGENVRYLEGLDTILNDGDTIQIVPAEVAG
jgi:molybdopterin synthase sulfur carrier subunit